MSGEAELIQAIDRHGPVVAATILAVVMVGYGLFRFRKQPGRMTPQGFARALGFYLAFKRLAVSPAGPEPELGPEPEVRLDWLARNETTVPGTIYGWVLRLEVDGVEIAAAAVAPESAVVAPRRVVELTSRFVVSAELAAALRRGDQPVWVTIRQAPNAPEPVARVLLATSRLLAPGWAEG